MTQKIDRVYTILEINTIIQGMIRQTFPDHIWVCGEIQDFKPNQKYKHVFFTLCQKHPHADEIVSRIKAVMFEESRKYIFDKLEKTQKDFVLHDDLEVKVLCKVDAYAKGGDYRLIIADIDPLYTLGQLARQREKIIEYLKTKGLLELNRQHALPSVPIRIGLVTSFNSAAYHDFISELTHSRYAFIVHCFDAHMQGTLVENDVVRALRYFKRNADVVDLVVITRGGGSTSDLSWFDNQRIAEEIAGSPLPVLSAIGHEINTTIADLVAHTSFKTPTKAAQFIVEQVTAFLSDLEACQEILVEESAEYVRQGRQQLHTMVLQVAQRAQRYFLKTQEGLRAQWVAVSHRAGERIRQEQASVQMSTNILKEAVKIRVERESERLHGMEEKIVLLDPRRTLQRGYSITLYRGRPLKDAAEAVPGETIETILLKGKISSTIEKKATEGV